MSSISTLSHLECPECGRLYEADRLQTYCHDCLSPLLARYDLAAARQRMGKEALARRPDRLWRWRELLPVRDASQIITLGEGDSPLLPARSLGAVLGLSHLFIKDESGQPTGSFKARGLAVAVSRAIELGARTFVIPTAGNAGGALAAYAARAGAEAHVFMPRDAPAINIAEVEIMGADLQLVDGLISDAGRLAEKAAEENGWFDVSTLKEPYRLEGKKTMGLELAEGFNWQLPDVILYPTGGGTGLIGMWKAFEELEAMGWIGSRRPRMVAVQAAGCAPIVRAFEAGARSAAFWQEAHTIASGLRVPHAFGHRLILRAIYESGGMAVSVTDEEIAVAQRRCAQLEGLFLAPEGAATIAAAARLRQRGWLGSDESVLLYNTGTGLKYVSASA